MAGVITVAIKQLLRGDGLKIAVLTSFITFILTLVVGSNSPRTLILTLPVFSALSAILTDGHNVRSSFYAMVIVGATIRHAITYSITVALVYIVVYITPLLVTKYFTVLEYCILVITLLAAIMSSLVFYYLHIKKSFSLVTT